LQNLKGRDHLKRRPWHRWDDNTRVNLWETVERSAVDASDSGWEPLMGSCEYSNEHSGSIKGTEFLD
jgi:hypothetical protein